MKAVADNNDGLNGTLLGLLQGVFEDVVYLDVTSAHAASPAPVHDVSHGIGVGDPSRRDVRPNLERALSTEIREFDLNRPRRKHFKLEHLKLIPDKKLVISFGGQCEDHARAIVHVSSFLLVSRGHPSIATFLQGWGLLVAMLTLFVYARSALLKVHARQDG